MIDYYPPSLCLTLKRLLDQSHQNSNVSLFSKAFEASEGSPSSTMKVHENSIGPGVLVPEEAHMGGHKRN